MTLPRPTSILYLATRSEPGGAQRYIADLARNLPPGEFSVSVAAGGGGEMLEQLAGAGIATFPLAHLRREISPSHDLAAIREIARLLRDLKPDVLHLNSSKAGVLGSLAAHRVRVPRVVYTAHGFVFNEPLPAWRRWTYRLLERISARWKDRIICVSEADRQSALRHRIAPAHKLTTIHNGLDLDRIHFLSTEEARQKISHHYNLQPTTDKLVGTIANLYPTKGVADLVAAATTVLRSFPQARFVAIGDGPERKKIERLIRQSNLEERFRLPGAIPDARRLAAAFDVYCGPSRKEGLPYSLLEAMAAERPIVATAVGGVPETLRDGREGLLVASGNPPALADGIVRLLREPDLAERLGAAAKHRVETEFTLGRMVEQTIACYRS